MKPADNKINIVVTGTEWMGSGVGSIESVITDLFKSAVNEIYISAYSIGNSSDLIFKWLEKALSRGVNIKMVINRLSEQPAEVRGKLNNFILIYPHFQLFEFQSSEHVDLHAKVIVVDHEKALVGSSNLSKRGLITNYEMGVYIEGKVASIVANTLSKLFDTTSRVLVPSSDRNG